MFVNCQFHGGSCQMPIPEPGGNHINITFRTYNPLVSLESQFRSRPRNCHKKLSFRRDDEAIPTTGEFFMQTVNELDVRLSVEILPIGLRKLSCRWGLGRLRHPNGRRVAQQLWSSFAGQKPGAARRSRECPGSCVRSANLRTELRNIPVPGSAAVSSTSPRCCRLKWPGRGSA